MLKPYSRINSGLSQEMKAKVVRNNVISTLVCMNILCSKTETWWVGMGRKLF